MTLSLSGITDELPAGITLNQAMNLASDALRPAGYTVVTYDFSPVPLTHDGDFILPTVCSMQNAPSEMAELWCGEGLYACDPVMDVSRDVTRPFIWSYRGKQSAVMTKILSDKHSPVVDYLIDTGMQTGITVPIRTPTGALATFSAISMERIDDAELNGHLSAVGYLAHVLHDAVASGFSAKVMRTPHVSLSRRERQCLKMCATGLTTKEIAHELKRSAATVTFHLTSASKKLGARNRSQALMRAAHYGLLNSEPLDGYNL